MDIPVISINIRTQITSVFKSSGITDIISRSRHGATCVDYRRAGVGAEYVVGENKFYANFYKHLGSGDFFYSESTIDEPYPAPYNTPDTGVSLVHTRHNIYKSDRGCPFSVQKGTPFIAIVYSFLSNFFILRFLFLTLFH